jgi:hypothetical protein
MLSKKVIISWAKNLIYSGLIFCIGGVGSLSYFDGFLPGHDHGQHPYHLSIFEEPNHYHDLPPHESESEQLAQQLRIWMISRFMPDGSFLIASPHFAPGLAQFFTSGLSDGYILTVACPKIFDLPSLVGLVTPDMLIGQSAWLVPPEKPPSFPPFELNTLIINPT